jgi:hypothetical protein
MSRYTYMLETVFLPSDCEMGFSYGCSSADNKGYASSYGEFDEHCSHAYQYYSTGGATSRIKNFHEDGGAVGYWERSITYNSTYQACIVRDDGTPGY